MDEICLKSQELVEVPLSVLNANCRKLNIDFNDIAALPRELCEKLPHLTFLSINGNMLQTLPPNICLLTELTELYLKENDLTELPESIIELKHLRRLHLTGNNVKKFPENLHMLDRLSELVADENNIQSLPTSFGELKCLSLLSLSCNAIEYLPENFGSLRNLRELDLSNNSLRCLPETFQYLPALEVIDLNNNKIKTLPKQFQSSNTLLKFVMSQNHLSSIPVWFTELENVRDIYLSDNCLQETPFPEDFGIKCSNLERLDLSGNNITSLPESFGKLKKLTFLDLGSSFDELERNRMLSNGNDIVYLPNSFCDLKQLSKLELDENDIRELPEEFGLLASLTYLDLSHNLLKSLPESFGQLQQLRVCMLSINYITHLPESLGLLKAVEDLKLDNNLIEHLPESFGNLTGLISLDLYNNNLKEAPEAVKKFKCLKHLDLRENDFGSTLDELLDITFEPTYPVRDPDLQNNWRGRKRPDIQPVAWVEKKGEPQNRENLQNDILYNALVSSSALWRRHGQSDIRSKSHNSSAPVTNGMSIIVENDSNSPLKPANEEIQNSSQSEECWDDDLLSVPSEASSPLTSFHESGNPNVDELSDWETESEPDFPNNFRKIYKHLPGNVAPDEKVLFIPSDIHAKTISRVEVWSTFEDGQFDDAES